MTRNPIGEHAVVLGASAAGLLAARVLADAYPKGTVIERDHVPLDLAHGSLARAFTRMMGMADRPEGLLRADRALRVLWAHLRGRVPAPATAPATGPAPNNARRPLANPARASTFQRP